MAEEVIPTGDRMVYAVRSDRVMGKRYRVDLTANRGNGRCSCADHGTRRQPFLDAGGDGFAREGYCKHLLKARNHFLKELLRAMAKSEES